MIILHLDIFTAESMRTDSPSRVTGNTVYGSYSVCSSEILGIPVNTFDICHPLKHCMAVHHLMAAVSGTTYTTNLIWKGSLTNSPRQESDEDEREL